MEKNEALKEITEIRYEIESQEYKQAKRVVEAKQAGASWAEIGNALNLTRQRAHQKFSDRVESAERMAKWAAANPEEAAAAEQRGRENARRNFEKITAEVDAKFAAEKAAAKLVADDAQQPITPSIFSDSPAPAKQLETTETADGAEFWEAKRRYAVTDCGAIYAPQGENGWKLDKVERNITGKNHPKTLADLQSLYAQFPGVMFINREKRAGLIRNAAIDRDVWLMAATDSKEHSVTANQDVTRNIDSMREELAKVHAAVKANRKKKEATK